METLSILLEINLKIYVAGPMRGYPEYNFPAFYRVSKKLRGTGWEVTNPAEIANEIGWDESTPERDLTRQHLTDFILRDVKLVSEMDAICMLLGYQGSKGAMVELSMARYVGIDVYYEVQDGIIIRGN